MRLPCAPWSGSSSANAQLPDRRRVAPRIVSLVPSLTELLFALGLGDSVVGRTGFCVHPRDAVRRVPKVGGTKTVNLERIRALKPTHLVVNVDENEKPTVEELARFIPEVVVTHPLTVEDNFALFAQFGEVFDRQAQARGLAVELEAAREALLARTRAAAWAERPVIYLIWKDPWMTISGQTYIASMLALAGFRAIAPPSQARYPTIDWQRFEPGQAEGIFFSSEPYRFRLNHVREFALTRGIDPFRCCLIDGEFVSWYGPRAIQALPYLMTFRETFEQALEKALDRRLRWGSPVDDRP